MSKKRNKQHKPGERISVYLNKDLPPHFFEWLSKQDDVSAFVLYAMERLYAETGNINVSGYLPRRFFFEDSTVKRQDELPPRQVYIPPTPIETPGVSAVHYETPSLTDHIKFEETEIAQNNEQTEYNQAIDNDEETKAQELPQQNETKDMPVPIEEDLVIETATEPINRNTKWANLDHINPDDF